MTITWTNERRKLSQLIPWPRNPRQIKRDQVERLQVSLEEFGQPEVIAIGPGNEVYNGHQRLKAWAAKFGDIEVDVRVASRALTEKEREKLTIFLHKGAAGEWDFDTLANEFEFDELVEWGFTEYDLGIRNEVDYDKEWQGMPEFEMQSNKFRSLIVHFENQDNLNNFLDLIEQEITDKTKFVWYPAKEKDIIKDRIFVNES